ncbi:hypothetical protein F4824DRAFT_505160 [Ustulina deusta]|nr:hypothetical protein F4824DRAFT_505160 [Ustulina deusta]
MPLNFPTCLRHCFQGERRGNFGPWVSPPRWGLDLVVWCGIGGLLGPFWGALLELIFGYHLTRDMVQHKLGRGRAPRPQPQPFSFQVGSRVVANWSTFLVL